MWREDDYARSIPTRSLTDMGTIVPAISGPKRPQDFVALTNAKTAFPASSIRTFKSAHGQSVPVDGREIIDLATAMW